MRPPPIKCVVEERSDGVALDCTRIPVGRKRREFGSAIQICLPHADFSQGRRRAERFGQIEKTLRRVRGAKETSMTKSVGGMLAIAAILVSVSGAPTFVR